MHTWMNLEEYGLALKSIFIYRTVFTMKDTSIMFVEKDEKRISGNFPEYQFFAGKHSISNEKKIVFQHITFWHNVACWPISI